ncbi:YggT family protein [Escherichia coli]
MAPLLRIWMQWAHCDFYNPFSQFVVKEPSQLSGDCAALFGNGTIDSASLLVAYILNFLSKPSCCLKW